VHYSELVNQIEEEQPAQELLSEITALTSSGNGKTKRGGILPPVGVDECKYTIPKSWVWARLGDLCYIITDGTHLTPTYVEEGRLFISAQNVKPFRFMPDNHKKVSEPDYINYVARVRPEKGDILMTRVGAMIGETAIIDRDIEFAFYVSLCLMKPAKEHLYVPYLLHWLNSPYGAASAREKTLGKGHSQGNLNLNLIRRFPVPLPPLAEQKRIVDYLEVLRAKEVATKRLHEECKQEHDAILPAILDRVFRGEL
jgi:type I restriction enzyme, S subunit